MHYFQKDDERGLWKGNWLPVAKLIRDVDATFSGGGILIKPLEPMRSWRVIFKGKLVKESNGEQIQVSWIF